MANLTVNGNLTVGGTISGANIPNVQLGFMQLQTTSDIELSQNTDVQVTGLSEQYSSGNGLTFSSASNNITVGSNVSYVRVSCIAEFIQNSTATRFSITVKVNGANPSGVGGTYLSQSSENVDSLVVTTNAILIAVAQNDVITFFAKSENSNNSNKDKVSGTETHFIVEAIGTQVV